MTRYVYEKQMCFKIYRFDIDILHCDVLDTLTINIYKRIKTPKQSQTRTGTPPKLKTEIER